MCPDDQTWALFLFFVSYLLTLAPSLCDANHSEIDCGNTYRANNWGYDGIYLTYCACFVDGRWNLAGLSSVYLH